MSHLKDILGEDLYDQVKERIGNTEITVVDPDNPMIPKRRLDEVIADRNRYKELVEERDTQLADLKNRARANETLQAQIAELQAKNKQAAEEHEKQLREQRFAVAVERAIIKAGARNVRAVAALLDKTKISLVGEDLFGIEEQVAALKKSDPFLFGVDLKGRIPEGTGKPPQTGRYRFRSPNRRIAAHPDSLTFRFPIRPGAEPLRQILQFLNRPVGTPKGIREGRGSEPEGNRARNPRARAGFRPRIRPTAFSTTGTL